MSDKTDPWGELMAAARKYAIRSAWDDVRYCDNCGGEWPRFKAEHHEPDCPVRPDRENPYAGLVEAAADLVRVVESTVWPNNDDLARGALRVSIDNVETALAKVRGDG